MAILKLLIMKMIYITVFELILYITVFELILYITVFK